MNDCLFCKIAAGQIPSNKLYEDDQLLAFYDIDPQAPTHFLVIPKQHIDSAAALTESDAALLGHVYAVIADLCRQLGVAENGAVWLPQRARHKALYFAVESLVILLPRDAVVATMQDAVEDPRFDRDFGFGCFMSGPSKTADIEQALVIGAHGPMSVTVVLTGGKEAAR